MHAVWLVAMASIRSQSTPAWLGLALGTWFGLLVIPVKKDAGVWLLQASLAGCCGSGGFCLLHPGAADSGGQSCLARPPLLAGGWCHHLLLTHWSHCCCWTFRSGCTAFSRQHAHRSCKGRGFRAPAGSQYWHKNKQNGWLCRAGRGVEGLQVTVFPFVCRVQPCGGGGSCCSKWSRLPQTLCGETCQRWGP